MEGAKRMKLDGQMAMDVKQNGDKCRMEWGRTSDRTATTSNGTEIDVGWNGNGSWTKWNSGMKQIRIVTDCAGGNATE